MTCTPNVNSDQLSWDFTGALAGGESGHVGFDVKVDN